MDIWSPIVGNVAEVPASAYWTNSVTFFPEYDFKNIAPGIGDEEARSAMTGTRGNGMTASLSGKISAAFGSLWTEYADKQPSEVRTEIDGNVVTCRLIDAVGTSGELNPAAYKRDAVAAVARLTRQRVRSFVSSHDHDTDVATEIFTLEPSLQKGRSRTIPS